MSWVDQQQGQLADDPVRRVFYFRTTLGNQSFYLTDQVPQQIVLRVSAVASFSSSSTLTVAIVNAGTVSRVLELRMYDAFSTERTWNSKNETPYILLGYFFQNSMNNTTTVIVPFSFTPAPAVETFSMSPRWNFVLYDPGTGTSVPDGYIQSVSIAVDVRRGGKIIYTN